MTCNGYFNMLNLNSLAFKLGLKHRKLVFDCILDHFILDNH